MTFSQMIRDTQKTLHMIARAKEIKAELDQLYPGRSPESTEQILLSFIAEQGLGETLLDIFREEPDNDLDPAP